MLQKVAMTQVTGCSNRIRVLFVAHDAQLHGAQLTLLNILRNLDRSKFTPFVVSPQPGPFTEEVERMGVPIHTGFVMRWVFSRAPRSSREIFTAPWKIFRAPAITSLFMCLLPVRIGKLMFLVIRKKIDLVYTNTITVVDGAIAAKLLNIPHVWHLHENITANDDVLKIIPPKQIASYLIPKLSTFIVVTSQALSKKLFDDSYSLHKVNVIYNGVDTIKFTPRASTGYIHRELGIPIDAPLVAICGEVQRSKGIEVFIKAAAASLKTVTNAHFLIIGHGVETQMRSFVNAVTQYGLSRKIHFIGWRKDIPEIFNELQAIVIASTQEAFGLTAIEGMAAGKPIVATRCGGPEEIVDHGKTGYLIETNNEIELADRLKQILLDPLARQEMGNLGRRRVLQKFSSQRFQWEIERLLLDAVKMR